MALALERALLVDEAATHRAIIEKHTDAVFSDPVAHCAGIAIPTGEELEVIALPILDPHIGGDVRPLQLAQVTKKRF